MTQDNQSQSKQESLKFGNTKASVRIMNLQPDRVIDRSPAKFNNQQISYILTCLREACKSVFGDDYNTLYLRILWLAQPCQKPQGLEDIYVQSREYLITFFIKTVEPYIATKPTAKDLVKFILDLISYGQFAIVPFEDTDYFSLLQKDSSHKPFIHLDGKIKLRNLKEMSIIMLKILMQCMENSQMMILLSQKFKQLQIQIIKLKSIALK
ncbi:Hypothetical_protein [Hexamita inflata]|uniref:Hypothetical_protein n=1 Tax=Hexamita inflata TaxID=28002 RepID=A0AA86TIQ2_9EUKA|nr:Hypothetical protein HINF_LOCUS7469 [Hexamita inflata]CAI9956800.1 Hypothetical protein HINF_LOCUS44445 [Hexamita inflata]